MGLTLLSLSYSLYQIHWPVSLQRKTECILSGKDTNVSALFFNFFASALLTYSDLNGVKTKNSTLGTHQITVLELNNV